MTEKKRPPESAEKGEESDADQTPMGRFKDMTRRLLDVSNAEVLKERARLEKAKNARNKKR